MFVNRALRAVAVVCVAAVPYLLGQGLCAEDVPRFAVEPFWPKPLPDNWILGQVAGAAVGSNDHVWVIHRPLTLLDDEKGAMEAPPATKCCSPAPPVLEFDSDGNLLRSWGGPGPNYDWPKNEHGIFVDFYGHLVERHVSGTIRSAFAPLGVVEADNVVDFEQKL